MSAARSVIVNADDLGRTEGINRGIARAHEQGVVTSASLMVRFPAAAAAAAYAREHPELSVGLHVDLGEWELRLGEWAQTDVVVPDDDAAAVAAEVAVQLERFQRLVGRGPTHLDSHQHVHLREPVRSAVMAVASELDVPLRHFSRVAYRGDFYGQAGDGSPLPHLISVDGFVDLLGSLESDCTEIGCHPGYGEGLVSSYRDEREQEVETLCDPRVREALAAAGIELRSFHPPVTR